MDLLKPLFALLAIVNPIGVVPFFIHFTQSLNRAERQRTIRISAFSAFCVIAISALAGLKVIEFFGISLASFQVGGGTLLAEGEIRIGCVDQQTFRPRRIPNEVIDSLT